MMPRSGHLLNAVEWRPDSNFDRTACQSAIDHIVKTDYDQQSHITDGATILTFDV